ncbi:MAG: hypothetical protein PWP64_696, partial [Candidatus Cloacimonadota bacterium]|nr:hypothetical protein [Candidatus Cloacimonadota bacterium]
MISRELNRTVLGYDEKNCLTDF